MEYVATSCRPVFQHEHALARLRASGYKLGLASNSIRRTVIEMMERSELRGYLDVIVSNEDVERPKPAPDIYRKAMADLGVTPDETLVVEDNENGIRAATAAGAHVMVVRNPADVTLSAIEARIEDCAGAVQQAVAA
jgi:beta-phosphoglucomutase